MDNMIKAIFSASPTNMTMAQALQWDYNPSLISIPVFFVSSMGNGDENLVVSGTQLQEIFDAVPDCYESDGSKNRCRARRYAQRCRWIYDSMAGVSFSFAFSLSFPIASHAY